MDSRVTPDGTGWMLGRTSTAIAVTHIKNSYDGHVSRSARQNALGLLLASDVGGSSLGGRAFVFCRRTCRIVARRRILRRQLHDLVLDGIGFGRFGDG